MTSNNAINVTASGIVNYDGAGTFSGVSVTNHNLLIGGASNAITSLALTSGQLAIGSSGIDPVAATLTAGTGIGITNGAGSITINATGGGLTWTTITGATQTADVNNGYIANNVGTLVLTLPAASARGDVVEVTGINNATGWQVAQNAGNTIYFGTATTTPGVGGSLASTATRDTIKLMCITANATWEVMHSIGNITVV